VRFARWATRPLTLAFTALWAVALVPLWTNRFLPLGDWYLYQVKH
jgi:hypothetical protein